MPGLCGVIDLLGGTDPDPAADALLERVTDVVRHHPRHQVRHRVSEGAVRLAVVGHDSPCHRIHHRAATGTARGELWLGETYPAPAGGGATGFESFDPTTASGTFIGIRYDLRGGLELFTDLLATFPLVHRRCGRYLVFAPELKGVLAASPDDVRGDPRALGFFLATGYLPPGYTHAVGCRTLAPAARLVHAPGTEEVNERAYWTLAYRPESRAPETFLDEMTDTLRACIQDQMSGAARVGVLLSGGYDSRGILGAAVGADADVRTITWGHDPDLPGSDAVVAARLAERAGVPHRFEPLRTDDLPEHAARWVWMTDAAVDAITNYPEADGVFERLAADHDVLVRGDECFGMKWRYGVPDDAVARTCIGVFPFDWHEVFDRILTDEARSTLRAATAEAHAHLGDDVHARNPVDRKDEYYFKVRFRSYLNPLNAFKVQQVAMRNPLLDRRMLELVTRLPRSVRRSKGLFKRAVTERLAVYPDVPFASRTSLVPWGRVLREDVRLGSYVRDRLLDAPESLARFFDRRGLERQVDEWLAPLPASSSNGNGAARAASVPARVGGGGLRPRLAETGKRVAYHPATPRFVRARILPARNPRRTINYAFRALIVSEYVNALRSIGVNLTWE